VRTFTYIIALLGTVCTLASAPRAQAEIPLVTDTITRQLEAFKQDDFETAFRFASPMIKGMFGSSQRFGQMVRQGYPMVWRPADVRYGAAVEDGPTVRQLVIITDGAGTLHYLEYEMIPGADGWVINGVRRVEAPEVGV